MEPTFSIKLLSRELERNEREYERCLRDPEIPSEEYEPIRQVIDELRYSIRMLQNDVTDDRRGLVMPDRRRNKWKRTESPTKEEHELADTIVDTVCRYFSITKEDITTKNVKARSDVARAKKLLSYVLVRRVGWPLERIEAKISRHGSNVSENAREITERMAHGSEQERRELRDDLNRINDKVDERIGRKPKRQTL